MDSSLDLPPLNVTALLRAHQLSPKKSLGQNFLMDSVALKRVVEAASISPDLDVLEIGPGLGSLTRYLASAAHHVFAVEIDQRLIPILQEVLSPFSNVTIIHQDILEVNLADILGEKGSPYQVIANIPYYITSAVIRHLLEAQRKPQQLVLTIQREVAERICTRSGAHSLLSLSVQVYGAPHIVTRIPAGAFYPAPQVDSSVLRIDLYPQPLIPSAQIDLFFRLAKAGFGQKRKTLRNSLASGLTWPAARVVNLLEASGIDPQRRAETLSLDEWKKLVEQYGQH
jgi:16S rRNA (adenine1518-N6/adenine1519-N6)-dimethyltransferase